MNEVITWKYCLRYIDDTRTMNKWIYLVALTQLGTFSVSGAQRADITFILDGSGSIYDYHPPIWESQLDLVKKIINNLNIDTDEVRVAMVTFSDTASVKWYLDRYRSRMEVLRGIDELRFDGGRSNIQDALMKSWKEVFNGARGDREEVLNIIITFSDGLPTVNIDTTASTAEDVQAAGIVMSAVAVGRNPDRTVLKYLSNMQTVYDVDQLSDQALFQQFANIIREGTALNPSDPCASNPCLHGGKCFRSEDPFGWNFFCWCSISTNSGGRLCQIANPCSSCPDNTRCFPSITDDIKGRNCYDVSQGYRLVD